MKRLILLISVLTLFVFGGCGNKEAEKQESNSNDSTIEVADDNSTVEEKPNSDVFFVDNEVQIRDLKIKITETKVIKVGEAGNEYGDKAVFAIWYDTTNLTDKGVPSYLCGFTTLRKINYIKACFFQRFNTERTSFLYL